MAKTGTTEQVIAAFVEGRDLRTASAEVPGGCRVRSENGELLSYRTVVAVRFEADGEIRFGVTTRRYSVTTSKLVGHVLQALRRAGHEPGSGLMSVHANVPGRWGGFGPAWHATGTEAVPFIVLD